MQIFHNSQDITYRSPFGAAEIGSAVSLRVTAPDADSVTVRTWQDGIGETLIPMDKEGDFFAATLTMPKTPCLLWYSFIAENSEGCIYYGNAEDGLGGVGHIYPNEPKSYQITVYKESASPKWYKDALVYQIFPDRFARGKDYEERIRAAQLPEDHKGAGRYIEENWDTRPFYTKNPEDGSIKEWQFYGGTLEGIMEKLPYIRSMGATAIYLNPIFKANSNHRYDTADYLQIDPMLGDEETFSRLCAEAKKLGISIILDGVFSHTGADSVYFDKFGNYGGVGAYQNEDSIYRKWFRFQEKAPGYDCWWGVDDLPNVEEEEPSHLEYICGENGVIKKWLRAGAKGWRLDVADELPDAFIRHLRAAAKSAGKDNLLIGEVWEDASNKVAYNSQREYLFGYELDGTMNYPFRDSVIDYVLYQSSPETFCRIIRSLSENYPKENFYSCLNLIGSHDCVRILTALGGYADMPEEEKRGFYMDPERFRLARNRLKLLSTLQYAMPGVPVLYYGDEAGLQGHADPYNRGTYPWGHEDEELLFHYRMLGLIYQEHPVLKSGDFKIYEAVPDVIAIERSNADERIVTLVNRDGYYPRSVTLPVHTEEADGCAENYVLELLYSLEPEIKDGQVTIDLAPMGYCMVLFRKARVPQADYPRAAGVLCSLTSIPGEGTLGRAGRKFIDDLADAGVKLWQTLPLNPPGLGGSPYFSPSVFAGDVRYLDREELPDLDGYSRFCRENNFWLEDWALWSAINEDLGGIAMSEWPEDLRRRTNLEKTKIRLSERIGEIEYEQYAFFTQWKKLHTYARSKGIRIIGDIPIYAAPDSADVWSNPDVFQLNENGRLNCRAGVPGDYFTPEGQDWSNPLYNWTYLKQNGYEWWIHRIHQALQQFDYIRMDHFRGFAAFYAIPAGCTALQGAWQPGPGIDFIRTMKETFGERLPIIAEDLGALDCSVYNLIKLSGFPGMNVWQFASEEMMAMSPEEMSRRIFYSGTHDNQTLAGWCAETFAGCNPQEKAWEIMDTLLDTNAPWVIFQLQDVLGLGDEARFNVPGTVSDNWSWKAAEGCLTPEIKSRLREAITRHGR